MTIGGMSYCMLFVCSMCMLFNMYEYIKHANVVVSLMTHTLWNVLANLIWIYSGNIVKILLFDNELKVHGLISQVEFSVIQHHPRNVGFQISEKSVKPFGWFHILQLPIPYCVSLIMITITSHIFINIFQTVHF